MSKEDYDDTLAALGEIADESPLSHPAGTNPEALFFLLRSGAGARLLAIPVQWQGRPAVLRGKQGNREGYQVRYFRLSWADLEEITGFEEGLSSAMESLLDAPAKGFIPEPVFLDEAAARSRVMAGTYLSLFSDRGADLGSLDLPAQVKSVQFGDGFLIVDDV